MADEQTNEGIAAIALPAGSFDLQSLEKALGKATGIKDREQHPERVTAAIADEIVDKGALELQGQISVPFGAKLVEQETVYGEGMEPVKTLGVVFEGVDAKDGGEAAQMRYERDAKGNAVGTTGTPVAPDAGDAAKILADQAAAQTGTSTDTTKGTAGGTSSK